MTERVKDVPILSENYILYIKFQFKARFLGKTWCKKSELITEWVIK